MPNALYFSAHPYFGPSISLSEPESAHPIHIARPSPASLPPPPPQAVRERVRPLLPTIPHSPSPHAAQGPPRRVSIITPAASSSSASSSSAHLPLHPKERDAINAKRQGRSTSVSFSPAEQVLSPHPSPSFTSAAASSASYPQPRRRVSLSVPNDYSDSSPTSIVSSSGSEANHGHPHMPYPSPAPHLNRSGSSFRAPKRRSSTINSTTPISTGTGKRAKKGQTIQPPKEEKRYGKTTIVLLVLLTLFLIGTVIVLSIFAFYFGVSHISHLTEDEVPWRPEDTIPPLKYRPAGTLLEHGKRFWQAEDDSAAHTEAFVQPIDQLIASEQEQLELEHLAAHVQEQRVAPTVEWDIDGPGSGSYWMRRSWNGHVEGTHEWFRLYNVTARPGEKIPRIIHQTWMNDVLPEKWRKAWKECREGMPDYEYMLWTDDVSRDFIATHYPSQLQMYDSYKYPIQRADSIRYFVLHHFGGVYMDLDIGCRRRLDPLLQGDWEVVLPITKPVGVSNDLIFSAKGSAFMDATVHGLAAWNHEWVINYPTVMFSTGPMFLSGQYSIYSSAHPLGPTHPRAEVRTLPKDLYGKNAPPDAVPHSFFFHFYGSSWHDDDAGFIWFLAIWGRSLMYLGVGIVVLGALRVLFNRFNATQEPDWTVMPILPTAHEGPSSPTNSTSSELSNNPFDHVDLGSAQLPHDLASAFRKAGNLILAAPATVFGRNGRRRQGLLYFVPTFFQPGQGPPRRSRATSDAPLPLRRPRRERRNTNGPRIALPPPPYEGAILDQRLMGSSPAQMEKEAKEGYQTGEEGEGYFTSHTASSSDDDEVLYGGEKVVSGWTR